MDKNTTKRLYDDACAAAHALDILGERWALLVVRELMFGPKRFTDLRAGLPGISANVLTQRLQGLEAAGVLVHRRLPPPASAQVYELTPWGYETEPVFQVLGRWGSRSPLHDPERPFSAASLLLSLRTMLAPDRAIGIDARIGLHLGDEQFVGRLSNGHFPIARGAIEGADLTLRGDPMALAGVIYGGVPLADMESAGAVRMTGDRQLGARFLTLFPLPPKIGDTSAFQSA